jgi:uracil-DNA glycosylase family 4
MKIKVPNNKAQYKDAVRIAFIGESPGSEEERLGQPFRDYAGSVLETMCREAQIMCSASFFGYVYQYKAVDGWDKIDRNSPEWIASQLELVTDLKEFDPQIIIALGEGVLNELTGKKGISKWRSSFLPCTLLPNKMVMPTFSPQYIVTKWEYRPIMLFDIEKAKEYALEPYVVPQRNYVFDLTYPELMVKLQRILDTATMLTIDIEATRKTNNILCFGFGLSAYESLTIPFDRLTEREEFEVWKMISKICLEPRIRKVIQNALYDVIVLATKYGVCIKNLYMDTLVANHNCYPTWSNSLAFLTSLYTKENYYKEEHKDGLGIKVEGEEDEDDSAAEEKLWTTEMLKGSNRVPFLTYNGKDCCLTYEIAQALDKKIDELGVREAFERDMAGLAPALEMTLTGFKFDYMRAAKEYDQLKVKIDANNNLITKLFGKEVNVKSPLQMQQLLYEDLKLPKKFKLVKGKKTDKLTVDADALLELARQYPEKGIQLLLKTVQLRTAQAFVNPKFVHVNGRVHAAFLPGATETGRWKSKKSVIGVGGRNIANIPAGNNPPFFNARVVYVADSGMILIGWDKMQAEARYVAYKAYILTGDDSYKLVVEGKEKIHNWFGKQLIVTGVCPLSEDEFFAKTTNDAKVWYYLAKMSIHGFSYDLGAVKWARNIAKKTDGEILIPTAQAKEIKEVLYASLPAIPKWHAAIREHLQTDIVMRNAFGRHRIFFERWGDELWREAYAWEPQSSIADDVSDAIVRLYKSDLPIVCLQQNYDSLLSQSPEALVGELLPKMKEIIIRPMTIKNWSGTRSVELTIPVEFSTGKNWGEMKEIKV